MPSFSFELSTPNNQTPEARITNLENTLEELFKRIAWLTSRLDSKNVKKLDTNETVIKSADGTTEIVGPVLVQKDSADVTRLRQGYDSSSAEFLFELYNEAGAKTVGIDSAGNATFTGIITGGTVRTAASGERIELTGNELVTYNSSNNKHGLVLGDTTGNEYGDLYLYDNGTKVLEFYNNLLGAGYTIRPTNSAALRIGIAGSTVYPQGSWDFTGATIAALTTDAIGNHDHGGAVAADGGHSHTVTV